MIISEKDECASDPCQNWGTCHDEINAFSCSCPSNLFNGSMCETRELFVSVYMCKMCMCVRQSETVTMSFLSFVMCKPMSCDVYLYF